MKLITIFMASVLVAAALADTHLYTSREAFETWAAKHGRTEYINSNDAETNHRYSIWKANRIQAEKDTAESLARNPNGAVFGNSPFMDMTVEEFTAIYLMPEKTPEQKRAEVEASGIYSTYVPQSDGLSAGDDYFEWGDQGVVTDVWNQGACGSCWAFAAKSVIESAERIAGKGEPIVSGQHIVDCFVGYGCNGGDEWAMFREMIDDDHPVMHDEDYPYVAKTQSCQEDLSKADIQIAEAFRPEDLGNGADETLMMQILRETGPMSAGISADRLMSYDSGIISGSCGGGINHSTVITGYGSEDGVDYWNIKNSWGSTWGEDGYFRFERNTCICYVCADVSAVTA